MTEEAELQTVKDGIYLRGLFLHRYGGIEFALSELITRARHHPAYNFLGDLPRFHNQKLESLAALIAADGPIRAYEAELKAALGNFNDFEERRHFLAHGIMGIPRDAIDRSTLGFSMYVYRKVDEEQKSVVHVGRMSATMDELRNLAEAIQPISTGFTSLVARICREVPLPILDVIAE
jgi:hypothetical protein